MFRFWDFLYFLFQKQLQISHLAFWSGIVSFFLFTPSLFSFHPKENHDCEKLHSSATWNHRIIECQVLERTLKIIPSSPSPQHGKSGIITRSPENWCCRNGLKESGLFGNRILAMKNFSIMEEEVNWSKTSLNVFGFLLYMIHFLCVLLCHG